MKLRSFGKRVGHISGLAVFTAAATSILIATFSSGWISVRAADSTAVPEPTPRTADGKPDLSGVWNGPGQYLAQQIPDGKLPYTPAGEAAYKYNMTEAPDPQSLCVLIGQPRADLDGQVFEIFQTPGRVAFLYERDTVWRLIWTDGRSHPKNLDSTFFGDAVGRWDGDTFVVDVVGIKGAKIWTDNVGHPQSDAMHVVERWTRPDADHLQVDVTIDDPKFYSKPLHVTRHLTRQHDEVIEMACDENNVDRPHLGVGLGTKDGNRGFDRSALRQLSAPASGANQ